MHFIREMLSYAGRHKLLCGLFVLGILLEVSYAVAAPLSLKYLVDEAFTPRNLQVFILILSLLLIGGLINIGANALGDYSLGKLSGEIVRKLRMDLFVHMQRQPLTFYQKYKVGDLVTRFSSDMSSIERTIRGSTPFFLKEALSVMLGLGLLFFIEWRLTLAMLAGAALLFLGPRLLQGRASSYNFSFKEAQEQFSNTIDEMAKGHRTIRGLNQNERFRERAKQQINQLFTLGFQLHIVNSLLERIPLIALLIMNGLMIGLGGYLIFQDIMSVGEFMAFFTLFLSTGQSASSLTLVIPSLIESSVSFQRIQELHQQPAVIQPAQSEALHSVESIQFQQVTFGYTEESDQLKEIDLFIPAGTYTAFVGSSGSGKSTALGLLARFYDPRAGAVVINGIDLKHISDESLRQQVLLVGQETFLFNSTIRDNLQLDLTDLTEEEMFAAAQQAQIHERIIQWPQGYETWIHQGGASLSGGERQRIAIARALLRKPQVLLFDEVTSALDPATENEINALIQQLRLNHTIVSVTHRLASVIHADQIHVFHEGRIVESGTHQELLSRNGLYTQLWEKQHGFQLSEDGLYASVDAERLGKLPFFSGIEAPLLHNIALMFSTEVFKQGDVVVREGEEGNKFYIIARGIFEVLKRSKDGTETRVAQLQDGDHFGEIALLKEIPRTATVRAMGPSVLLSVRREAFHQLTNHYPQLLSILEKSLASRM